MGELRLSPPNLNSGSVLICPDAPNHAYSDPSRQNQAGKASLGFIGILVAFIFFVIQPTLKFLKSDAVNTSYADLTEYLVPSFSEIVLESNVAENIETKLITEISVGIPFRKSPLEKNKMLFSGSQGDIRARHLIALKQMYFNVL